MSLGTGYEDYAFIADLYDYVVPYRDRPDIGFFVEAAEAAGSPVLELGCGTGRALIPTADRGGMTAFRRPKSHRPPRQVSLSVLCAQIED